MFAARMCLEVNERYTQPHEHFVVMITCNHDFTYRQDSHISFSFGAFDSYTNLGRDTNGVPHTAYADSAALQPDAVLAILLH